MFIDETAESYDIAEPRPDSMIQSLRAFGYDLPAAIADLVDNSISAEAKNIWIDFHWNGDASYISVIDDGNGMSEAELVDAMRPGSRNPLEDRDPKDLGRFGLGLKTASFSQCKRLTVASKPVGATPSVRCWDLDYVSTCGQWRLLRSSSEIFNDHLLLLCVKESGTAVLWEKTDRLTAGNDVNDAQHHKVFLGRVSEVRDHISMVFHRFLDGPRAIKIFLNDQPVKPWDPFLTKEPATQLLTEEPVSLFGKRLIVKPYVLPHHSKTSPDTYQQASGPKGWNAHQGFYVYRNKRLLVAGDWLGLGFLKEEHYKLARIMLDIPNSMDAEWEIDVKKSRACPPPAVRSDLKRLATLTRSRASDVYRYRGARIHQGPVELTFLWEKRVRHGKIAYSINRDHPLVKDLLSGPVDLSRKAKALLSLIEETVPVPTITMDGSESPNDHAKPFENVSSTLRSVLGETYRVLRESGLSSEEAKLRIMALEPFNEHPELVAALDD